MRLVLLSDTHGQRPEVPDGDVLIHAGDLTMDGESTAILDELIWLTDLPHWKKVIIAGNHDFALEHKPVANAVRDQLQRCGATYLDNEATVIDGVKFYGSPVTPWFHDWAFNVHRGPAIRAYWEMIPTDTDVLITHGPPAGWGSFNSLNEDCGCHDLNREVVTRIQPKVHVFGHIHEGYGVYHHPILPIKFVNASVLDNRYRLVNSPVVVDI